MDTPTLPGYTFSATGGELCVRVCGATFAAHTGGHTIVVRRDADGAVIDTLAGDPVAGIDELRHIAEHWVASRLGTEAPREANCRSCGMVLGSPTANPSPVLGGRGSLTVTFCGGYGHYIDPERAVELSATICAACADELCAAHPWVDELLHHTSAPLPV